MANDRSAHARTPAFRQEVGAYARAHGNHVAAERYAVPFDTVRKWARGGQVGDENRARAAAHEYARGERAVPLDDHAPVRFDDLKIASMEVEEVFDAMIAMQDIVEKARAGQDSAKVTIETTEPIVKVFSGDWHVASFWTQHREFREDFNYVRDTPHVYLTDMGDPIENTTQFRSTEAVLNQLLHPDTAKQLLLRMLGELARRKKLVARVWSNHLEGRDERIFGGGSNDEYNRLCPYLDGSGRLSLTVGRIVYEVVARHVMVGHSMWNQTHANRRLNMMEEPDADILVSAHTHDGLSWQEYVYADRARLAWKCATYKSADPRSNRFHRPVTAEMGGIVLYPDRKEWVCFRDLKKAVLFRSALVGHAHAA